MFCCTLLYVHSSIAIILFGKREQIALSSPRLVMVERLFLAVPRGCLQFVIVVFPDHTHLLFLYPRYEVYRGYIVTFCLFCNMFVCLSVNFFSVKDFSATTWVRILKFGTKLESDELYCVTNKQPHIAYQSLYLFIFLFGNFCQISQLLLEPVFSILCTPSGRQSVLCKWELRC